MEKSGSTLHHCFTYGSTTLQMDFRPALAPDPPLLLNHPRTLYRPAAPFCRYKQALSMLTFSPYEILSHRLTALALNVSTRLNALCCMIAPALPRPGAVS